MLKNLILVLALLLGASNAFAQGADGATLSWSVQGLIKHMPGQPETVPFSCTVTAASPTCLLPMGTVRVKFYGVDGDSFAAEYQSAQACGAASSCTAQLASGDARDQVDSVSCTANVIAAASSARAYFPCRECFGGLNPSFILSWDARATCVTTTTSTSSSTTTSSSTSTTTSSTTSTTL